MFKMYSSVKSLARPTSDGEEISKVWLGGTESSDAVMKTAPRLANLAARIKRQSVDRLWPSSSDSESSEDEFMIDFESSASKVGNLNTMQSMNGSSAESGEKMSN